MSTEIVSARAVKDMIQDGWELWHIANRQYPKLPGHWEMRKRHKIQRVNWCAIEKLRQRGPFWGRHAALTVREVCRDWYGNAAGGTNNYDLCGRCSGNFKKWLYSLDDCEYSQGIAADGPAILRDGVPMTPEAIVAQLNRSE